MHRVFGIVGRSGSGKTTLIEAMIPWFSARSLQVAVIKHSHHDLQFEPPHKDSSRFRSAGAHEVIVASPFHYALFHNLHHEAEPNLVDLVNRLQGADIILVEGYRQAVIPRIEVYRPSRCIDPIYQQTEHMVAIASDDLDIQAPLPILDLNSPAHVAQFILDFIQAVPGTMAKE